MERGAVEDSVGDTFDVLPAASSEVLVLHKSFTLPIADRKGTENVEDPLTLFDSSMVAEETASSTAFIMLSSKVSGNCLSDFIREW